MTKKLRKILIFVLVCVFAAVMILLAATNARYVSSPSPSSGSVIDTNELVYTLSDQCVVTTQEELESAIKNETQNIKLGGDEDTPFYINTDDLTLESDLILDLNGHEVMCITRDPILTVGTAGTTPLRLLVTDTSAGQTGSFYNPVGSVLSVEGGIVTTSGGKYESGPRKTEYYSNKDESDYTGGEIINSASVSVTYQRDSSGATQNSTASTYMPIIAPNTASGTVMGNIFFDSAYTANSSNIPADTYLYFISTDFESSATLANPSKADFYYTYYLKEDNGSYLYSVTEAEGYSQVVICGYYNDKKVASDEDNALNGNVLGRTTSNFAAIKMQSGNIYVRGGNFYSWFGKSTAYCISATGAVSNADSDTAVYSGYFEAIEEGVCVRCAYDQSTPELNVYGGEFYSYKGDMVQIEKGTMNVTGGTFTKDTTDAKYGTTYSTAATAGANNSAIYINGGTMTVTGTADSLVQIYLNGPAMDGIKCQNNGSTEGKITAEYAIFTYNGGSAVTGATTYVSNVGIANYGGTVEVTSCLFDTNDSDSIGVKSESGTLNASGCNFVLSGEDAIGIKADGGTVSIGNASDVSNTICMFYIDHVYNCYGIYADTTESIAINVNAAQFIMGQGYYSTETNYYVDTSTSYSVGTFVSAGIYMNASSGKINLMRAVFMMAGNYSAGVYAAAGEIEQDDGSSDYTSALLIGVAHAGYEDNGICSSSYTSSFSETRFGNSYFVAMYGESTSNGTYTASTSFYTSDSKLNDLQFTGLSATGTAIGSYGIYSGGGTITVDKAYVALCSTYGAGIYTTGGTMTIADFECDVRSTDSTSTTYPGSSTSVDVSSSAIASGASGSSASITITKSNINTDAFGYNVLSGALIFAGESTDARDNTLNSVRATAIYVNGANLTINADAELTLTSTIATSAGWTDPSGTLLTEYNSTSGAVSINPDGIYVSGGSFTSNGTLNVAFAGVNNDTSVTYFTAFVIASYAVKVTGDSSPAVTITKGTITSSIGGGVEVDSSNGAVTLGVINAANTALAVTTTGTGTSTSLMSVYDDSRSFSTSNWQYYLYTQSGHAVKVDGGTLTINSGTYSATQGNGIFVNGDSSTVVNIYDGSFVGNEYELYQSVLSSNEGSHVGPAISYGLKLFNGTMYVYGGTFGTNSTTSASNGVFIMGTSDSSNNNTTGYDCNAYLYGGTYYGGTGRAVSLMGYCYTQVGTTDTAVYSGTSPTISGAVYGVGLEPFDAQSSDNYSYAGSFVMQAGTITSSSQDGIWVGNKNYTITIQGATPTTNNGTTTYGVDIYGAGNGINFYYAFASAVNITNAKIYGGNGIYFADTLSNNVTITSSLIYATGGNYGINFNKTIFTGSYAFTIDSSTVYGGSGILFSNSTDKVGTGTYGSMAITSSTIYSSSTDNWHGLEVNGDMAMPIAISSSVIGSANTNNYAIKITGALSGDLTVSGSSRVYSSGNYAIYVGGNFSSSISVTDSAEINGSGTRQFSSTKYDIYLNNANNGSSISVSSSNHSNNNKLMVRANSGGNNINYSNDYVTVN